MPPRETDGHGRPLLLYGVMFGISLKELEGNVISTEFGDITDDVERSLRIRNLGLRCCQFKQLLITKKKQPGLFKLGAGGNAAKFPNLKAR